MDLHGEDRRVIGAVGQEYTPMNQVGPALRVTLTPDGKSLTYSIGKFADNLWLLDGLDTVPLP